MQTLYNLGFPPATLLNGTLERYNGKFMCHTQLFSFPVSLSDTGSAPTDVRVGIRPQHLCVNERPTPNSLKTEARIILLEDLGGELVIYLDKDGFTFESVLPHAKDHLLNGDEAVVHVDPRMLLVFDPQSGMKIGQGVE
jgi:hypothetical protein